MQNSIQSKASNASSQMLEELANRSQAKIYKVEGSFNDEEMRIIWNALGLYINRNLRMGRGISIPKLGVFTFTPPEVRLKGVTNEVQRDQRPRMPIFLIQKQFIKGLPLKTAIFYHQQFGMGIRPYTALGATGDIPITKMNLIEVASYANMDKDNIELGITRIIKFISEKLTNGINISLELPNVGRLISRGNLVAVKFNQFLTRDTRSVLTKSVDVRKQKGNMTLTGDNLKKFANYSEMKDKLAHKTNDFLQIDANTRNYLTQNFGLHFDDENMKRSTTNFDRTIASQKFDRTNKSLKDSQLVKMTQSSFFGSKMKNFNRDYNMALKIIKQWVTKHCENSQNSFENFASLSGRSTQALNQNDVWKACQRISLDITEQQAQQLYRLLDFNKDGFVTQDDWNKNIKFDINRSLKNLIVYIKKRKYKVNDVIRLMGIEGVKKVNIFVLKQGLKKIESKLQDQQALLLARYICRGTEVQIQNLLQILIMSETQENHKHVNVDNQWQEKFLIRLKKKMQEKQIFEEQLLNKMRFYDKLSNGYIKQSDFKNVLAQLGINLTLSELIKIVKVFPINYLDQIEYTALMDKLYNTTSTDKPQLSQQQFLKVMRQKILNLNKLPFKVPISVPLLVSELQIKYFKDYSQEQLLPYIRKMDINGNNEVCSDDYKVYYNKIMPQPTLISDEIVLQSLLIKLRERSIKKKISYYDMFKKLDNNNNEFISRQQWMKNLGTIISLNEIQKQSLFAYFDKKKLKIIDYQTFLDVLNGKNNVLRGSKYDWVEQTLSNIKKWYSKSGLTAEDAFKVIDCQGKSYLNQQSISKFLTDKLKYQSRELNYISIQKLLKLLDTYKRGKVNYIDWYRFITGQQINWLNSAKQQIGIVLSRNFNNLSDAYVKITQGQNKLLYSNFQKWILQGKMLSGFMINQDILKQMFAQFDQHKKGFLLQKDFISLFAKYNWKAQHTNQFIDNLKMKFKNCQQAFKCMINYKQNTSLDYNKFVIFLQQNFGDRFKKTDAKNIWNNISGNRNIINIQDFKKLYHKEWNNNNNPIDNQYYRDKYKYQDFNIIKGTQYRTQEFNYNEKEKMQTQSTKIVNNVKDMLATSPKTLQQVFIEVDTGKTGKINNLQFKKAFRNLNIALTSKQIDLLLNFCDYKLDQTINWRQFLTRLKLKEDKILISQRMCQKIGHISDLLHYYMVSPKDAFRKWNNPRTGYMSFEQFHKMLKNVYEQANQYLPELQILKDAFNHIDIRKDDLLDFQEWTQTFRNCKPPSLLMGTTPASTNLHNKLLKDKQENKPIREKNIPKWKHSPIYQEFVCLIGRNRRYLQQAVEKVNPQGQTLIPLSLLQQIIQKFCKQHKFVLEKDLIQNLSAFAMTGDKVDYRLLFNNFKDRTQEIIEFPKKNFF